MPSVSILLPMRNAATTLPACLASIRRQTMPDFDCVLVDDGSADRTAAIARSIAAEDPRFHVVPGPGSGIVGALQAGLERCTAPLVARMDADDVMHKRRLELQVAALVAAPELTGIGCWLRPFPSREVGAGMLRYARWLRSIVTPADVRADALVDCPVAHPTWLLRRDDLRAFGYRETGGPEDYDLLLRLLASGREFAVLPRCLHGWRRSDASLTCSDPRYAQQQLVACKAGHLAATLLRDQPRYLLWGYGSTGRMLARALASLGRSPAAIVERHPRRLGRTIRGAAVVPPAELARLPRLPLVVSVAGAAARAQLRSELAAMQFVELRDFVVAA